MAAASSADGTNSNAGASTGGEGMGAPPPLTCQKCGDITTMSTSAATGRNHLLRACNGCLATDRWLTRATAKPKSDKDESEDARVRRLNASKVKEDLKKKSPEEKREWYLDQKASRAAEDQKKKRTFSSAVGHVEEGREMGSIRDNVHAYIPFRRWAATEMALKVYNTLAEAKVGWEKMLADPATVCIKQNGETLVAEFQGVEARGRQSHHLRTGVRQRMDIQGQTDLDEYVDESESRLKRAKARLDVEITANAEKSSEEPQAVIPLLQVAKDLNQLREIEEARDAELQMQAQAIEEQRKEEANEKKRKLDQEPKSMPLEKLALQALRKKAVQTMTDLSLRLQTTLTAVRVDCEKLTECEGEDLKSEMTEKLEIVQHAWTELSEKISEYEKEWDEKAAEATAEEMAEIRQSISSSMKGFHCNNEYAVAVKNKLADVRAWMTKTKKAINEREKAAAKTAAGKKMAKMGASLPLESLAEGVAKHLDGVAGCGNVDYTLNGAKMLQSLAPVMFDMQRAKGLREMITSMDYYKLQKTWVLEKMKSTSSNSCCAVVSKKAVAKKIKDVVVKSWPEVYGNDVLRGMPSEMDDVFTLQFGQRLPSTANIWSRPEMNAPMFLVLLEGEMSVGGFPCKHVKGNTLAEHVKELEKMTPNNVAKLVQKVGWLVHLQAKSSVVIPPDTVWFEMATGQDNCHTIRQVMARQSLRQPMRNWLEKMNSEGGLADRDHLLKMLTYLKGLEHDA